MLANAVTNSCTTITFDSSVTLITLNSELTISATWTGTLDGGGTVAISGNNSVRVLMINNASANVTLKDITLKQGYAQDGGGVYVNDGMLMLDSGSTISNNNASRYCGGVYVDAGGTLLMNSGSTVSNNTASNSSGGGVYLHGGTLSMNNGSTISDNTAKYAGGLALILGTATLSGTIEGNEATGGMNGGGIYTQIDVSASSPSYGSDNTPANCRAYTPTGGVCP